MGYCREFLRGVDPSNAWLFSSHREIRWQQDVLFTTDLERFGALADRVAADASAPAALVDLAIEACPLPLAEGVEAVWLDEQRDLLRARLLPLLQRRLLRREEAGDRAGAAAAARAWLDLDPLSEPAYRALAANLYLDGSASEALAAIEAFQRHLAATVDLPPSEALSAQLVHMRAGKPGDPRMSAAESAQALRSLPLPLAAGERLFGRDALLEEGMRRTRRSRLVSLVGTGGVGKTRLGLALAARWKERPAQEAWWVDLSSLVEGALVPRAVAEGLGLELGSDQPVLDQLRRLAQGARGLLVLDNCEHLLGEAAAVIGFVLDACPGLSVLTTSREELGLDGETVVAVEPLPVPPASDGDAGADWSAVQLFETRVAARRPGWAASAPERATMAEICRAVDGLPLAIELAASRAEFMSLVEIRDSLARVFAVLGDAQRSRDVRQRTLWATIDWSYQLLSADEQCVFRRLSILPAAFAPSLAEAVSRIGVPEVDSVLEALVRKSMLLGLNGGARLGEGEDGTDANFASCIRYAHTASCASKRLTRMS